MNTITLGIIGAGATAVTAAAATAAAVMMKFYWNHDKRVNIFGLKDVTINKLLYSCETIKPGETLQVIGDQIIDEVDSEILSEMGCMYGSDSNTMKVWARKNAEKAMFCYPNVKIDHISVCDRKNATIFEDCNCQTTYTLCRKY